jgi:hypothetical protein
MSIYIHIDQRSHNNMLLILCGTLHENTIKPAYNCTLNVKPQRGRGLGCLGICGVFDHQLHPHPREFD